MADRESFFQKLLARRVPQILGLYIAAAWLTVEMGQWITGLLDWPDQLLVYVFVLLAAMLPSVIMLAWNHGAPGRDRAPRAEKIGVPLNALLAIGVVSAVVVSDPPTDAGGATVRAGSAVAERTLIDETGAERVFTVAREGFHKRVAAFFWTPTASAGLPEDHWQGHAIAWLLSVDLGRDPLLTVFTPYSRSLIEDLRSAGFERAVGEPLSLDLRLAGENDAEFLIRGRYERVEDGIGLIATVANVDSGQVVAEHRVEAGSLVSAVAELSDLLAPDLYGQVERDPDAFVDIRLEEAATDSEEALAALTRGFNAFHFERDLERALGSLQQATEIDPEFALAYASLSMFHRALGDMQASAGAIQQALALDYKLDSQTLFGLKANRYAVLGDYDKAMRVLEMWTEVHPESFQAHMTLARNMIMMGRVDAARNALDAAGELDPDNAEIDRLLFSVEKLSGDLDEAAERLRDYIESEPQDAGARIDLGNLHLLRGEFDQAREVLEAAELVAADPFEAELAQMVVDARAGRLHEALEAMRSAMERNDRPDELGQLIMSRYRALSMAGRFRDVIAMVETHRDTLRNAFPAANYWLVIGEVLSQAHSKLGNIDAALAELEEAIEAIGDPMGRYLSINRLMVLHQSGVEASGLEPDLERFRFFEENFSFSGTEAYLHLGAALVADRRGETGEAVDRMRSAVEAIRASSIALDLFALDYFDYLLGATLRKNGQLAEARSVLESLLARHPAHGPGRLELARVELAEGRQGEARRHLEELMDQWREADEAYSDYQAARGLLQSRIESR
ncbi:MAG: tetratricopeptide repeat protein [Gammaproteobacteria bacterium]|jgi:tetratricopeptide (TPR) repeat protein|nr:tetratricopeptide repeat protein [Gammaproteobacteria bacterium]